jgi:hypothetical protein
MSAPVNPRFADKLREQLRFLGRSASLYDQGAEDEALRMATALRVVLHDTKSGTSLFKHLALTNTQMLSSARGHGNWQDYLSQEINLRSSEPVKMRPLLGRQFAEAPFARWWSDEPVFVHQSKSYSRRLICLSAADTDGGAHVDSKLEEYYETLAAGQYMAGITGNLEYGGHPPPFPQGVTIYPKNAHFALIRQFTHEFLCSADHNKWH